MAKVNEPSATVVSPGESKLNTNALGLWGLVIMGIAYMGLALTAYFNFGIMEGITGPVVPLAFAAVTAANASGTIGPVRPSMMPKLKYAVRASPM